MAEVTASGSTNDLHRVDATGATSREIRGFRAPSFSLTRKTLWAVDILRASGIQYDSSVFPTGFHPDYGIGDADVRPYQIATGLTELPIGVAEVFGRRVPCGGGGYFRLYPYALTRWLIRSCNKHGRPVMFYLHPWELDPEQPRVKGLPWSKRLRHYSNLGKTEDRLEQLLSDFSFTSAWKLISER